MIIFFAQNIFGTGSKIWAYHLIKKYLKKNKLSISIFTNKIFISYLKSCKLKQTGTRYFLIKYFFSPFFLFVISKNYKKIYNLGDYPLPFIRNQVLYVNQANLIKPGIYKFSSRRINFILRRFYFDIFFRFVNLFYVQSNFMKKNLAESYGIKLKKIIVKSVNINLPRSKHKKKMDKNKIKIFYPANYYAHKNFSLLIDLKLKYNLDHCEIYLLRSTKNFIKHHYLFKYIDDYNNKDAYKIYSKFDCILYPSLIESCGLPLIEAKYFDIPVICSSLPYAKEIGLKKVFYFNPISCKSLYYFINKFINES